MLKLNALFLDARNAALIQVYKVERLHLIRAIHLRLPVRASLVATVNGELG